MSLVPQSRRVESLGFKGMNPWDNLEERNNYPRFRKHVLQTENKKEEFTLCWLEESNSLKSQQRRVRLGIMNNIPKVEHITGKDTSFSVNESSQEHTRHTYLRTNTGLTDSVMGREFGWENFLTFWCSYDTLMLQGSLNLQYLDKSFSVITPLNQNFCLIGYYRSVKGQSKNPHAGQICSALSQQHQIVCNLSG